MKFRTPALVLCLTATLALAHKIPDSAWESGTLRTMTSDSGSRLVGTLNDGHGLLTERSYLVMHYIIDGPIYTYEANLTLSHRWDKQLNVTVRGPIKYAVQGLNIYIQDDDGKVHKLAFMMKALR